MFRVYVQEEGVCAQRMGKDGDLWDDSALINAFDNAISSYKVLPFPTQSNSLSIQLNFTPFSYSAENAQHSQKQTRIRTNY